MPKCTPIWSFEPATGGQMRRLCVDSAKKPFWQRKSLDQMTGQEWESLCDGCARCCLIKLEDEDTGEVHLTRLACHLLDAGTCRCKDYRNRHKLVEDCLTIDAQAVRTLKWLPPTCAYRLVAEGKDLEWWHPLVSGSPDTVHEAGISVRGWTRCESTTEHEEMHRFIIEGF